jgi:outer membrane protein OmpA-like peptidoglycan-associated protein
MKSLVSALALAATTGVVFADDAPILANSVSLGAAIGIQRYDGSYGDNSMPFLRGVLTYHPVEDWAIRGVGGVGNISDGSSRFRTEWFSNIGVQGVYQPRFEALGSLRPYLATGVSSDFGTVLNNGVRVYDLDWNIYVPVEFGVDLIVSDNLSFNGFIENRTYSRKWSKLDGIETGDNYYHKRDELPRAGFGVTLRIGPATPEKVAVVYVPVVVKAAAPPVVRVDSDKDGVVDSLDRCPNTPAGVTVDLHGCPLDSDKDGVSDALDRCPNTPTGITVDAYGCPLDSDKDGVPDALDKCPNTPNGQAVDITGCPIDSDKDGIPDYLDKCPGTPAGVVVDSTGCVKIVFVKGTKLVLDGIEFDFGKATIKPSSSAVLYHAADAIQGAPKARIEIAGYTDNVGSSKLNLKLSANRAKAVKAYLVQRGVPSSQITAKGYGASEPVADNSTDEGRSMNRRIEFHVK